MTSEIWKPANGYETLYEVSNTGKVRSLHKRNYMNIMPQRIDRGGYYTIKLNRKGKCSTVYVHRLLGFAFIKNPSNKPFINHKDCNKLNNFLDNLEWVTHSENVKHAYENKRKHANKGKMHHEAVMLKCKFTGEIFYTIKEAALKKGFNYNTLRNSLNSGVSSLFEKIKPITD